ncbi:MAG: endonuclease/exonuclease/phosphatase family protein [Pseudomonadota bacterium]
MFRRRRINGLPGLLEIVAGLVLLWTIGFLLTGDHLSPVRLGVYAAPLIMIVAGLLSVWALWRRARALALALSAVAGGLFLAQGPPLVRAMATPSEIAAPGALVVLSLSNRTMNQDMRTTARMLRAEEADLIVLQEVADTAALMREVTTLPGPDLFACAHGSFMILSRFPVAAPRPGVWHGALICDVDMPGGSVAVASVHLPRAVASKADQDRVITHLLDVLARIQGPKIVAGDFNATPLTTPIRRVERHMLNAFAQAGRGFGFTFPTPARRIGAIGPFLTIDYIFHSEAFATVSAEVLDTHPKAADHFPIRAVLRRSITKAAEGTI